MITDTQIEAFYDTGYVVIPDIFGEPELEIMRSACDRLVVEAAELEGMVIHNGSQFVVERNPTHAEFPVQIKRVVWVGAAEPDLLKLGQSHQLTDIAGRIMDCDRLEHIINQVHFKLPNDGVFFPFHQDSRHRGYGTDNWKDANGRGSYVQIVTAIDRVTMENGPLLFIPGSCRNGHLDLPYDEQHATESPLFNPDDAVAVPMAPGTVAIFGPYTIHGSLPNTSTKSRRVFINGYAYPGANFRQYPGDGAGMLIDAR